ncbi:hypothetical protein KUTeg_010736 [Tegillarca granosa]|uniref:ZP domain-containing protein n=1 Tax=Tegillarca granosa TaxID=220873 RepID=A0ABQ9F5A6_TEGGR|nr:hypothetical protein KUTeg_010736 [Tegillarca granosa]
MSAIETVTDNIKQAHGHAESHFHNENVTGHYTVNMAFYDDSNFRYQKYGYPLTANIGDNVYVKVFTDIRDYNIKMRLNDCFTRPTPSAPDNLRFFLIRNGCPMDPNTHIISQSTHETRFKFQDFEYSTDHDNLYIYCNARFCSVNDYSYSCDQACHRNNRRMLKLTGNDTSIETVQTYSVFKQGKRK